MPAPPPAAAAPWSRSKKTQITVHVSVFKLMPLPPPEQDWAEDLPLDALLCILHKLGTVELLIGGAARVCRSWRRAAREEPELWRRIDMRDPSVPYFSPRVSLGIMVRQALRLSAGQCEVFSGGAGLDDHILLYLAEWATSLKSLHLIRSYGLSKEVFAKAINKFPLLEELELSARYYDADLIELVARVCPRLKHFTYVDTRCHCHYPTSNDRVAFAIATMHELHSLHLFGDTLSNKGLAAILDNCPYMEYLNVPYCRNINMDDVNLVESVLGFTWMIMTTFCFCALLLVMMMMILALFHTRISGMTMFSILVMMLMTLNLKRLRGFLTTRACVDT